MRRTPYKVRNIPKDNNRRLDTAKSIIRDVISFLSLIATIFIAFAAIKALKDNTAANKPYLKVDLGESGIDSASIYFTLNMENVGKRPISNFDFICLSVDTPESGSGKVINGYKKFGSLANDIAPNQSHQSTIGFPSDYVSSCDFPILIAIVCKYLDAMTKAKEYQIYYFRLDTLNSLDEGMYISLATQLNKQTIRDYLNDQIESFINSEQNDSILGREKTKKVITIMESDQKKENEK